MRKILAMMLALCTVFSSVCTIVLAQEQSRSAGTVSGNEAVVSESGKGDGNVLEAVNAVTMGNSGEAAENTVSGGNAGVADPPSNGNVAGKPDVEDGKNEDISTVGGDSMFEGDGTDERVDNEKYKFWYIVDEKGIVITLVEPTEWNSEDFLEIVIPEQIEGVDGKVYRIGRNAFGNCMEMTGSISLPDSITEIGDGAFWEVRGFSMTLPSGLKEVGDNAFNECDGLTGELPTGLTKIGDHAFNRCSGLSGNLVLSQCIREIGAGAFYGCGGFTGELSLPDGLEKIGSGAFKDCSGLTGSLRLPDGIKEIGEEAFEGCSGLSGSLDLPEGLLRIGSGAFLNCTGLCGELKLPESLEEIGSGAFSGFGYKDDDMTFIPCGFTGNLIIPDNVVSMGEYTFYYCRNFSGSLKLPSKLTEIVKGAFYRCSGLTGELKLPDGIKKIGEDAFCGCEGLTGELRLPDGLTEMGRNAFYNCRNLTGDLIIPDSVESIGALAFQNCNSLSRDIYMTESVKYIENTSTGVSAFVRSYDANTGERITVADITIHAPRGSYAETYAVENGYSYTDDNGYVHIGTGNNGNKEPGESDVPPAFLANTTEVKIQTTTERSDADKAVGIQSGEYLQVEISDAVNENVLKELNKAAVDKGLIISKVFNIELKVLEQRGKLIRKVSESNGEFTFTIPVPEGMNGDLYDFFILRDHSEGISILPDLDSDSSTVTFASDKFSAYAIAYKAKASSSGNTSTGGNRPDSSDNAEGSMQGADSTNNNAGGTNNITGGTNNITGSTNNNTVSTNDAADSNENASDGDSANSSSDEQRAGGQAGRDSAPRTGDELPIAVPATATVIFAVLSCILGGQELFGKRAEKTGKC